MPKATLTLTIPETVWMGELTRRYANAEFTVLAAHAGDHTGVGLTNISAPAVEPVVTDLETYDEVTDVEILEYREQCVLVQLETTLPILLEPVRQSGIPLEMPFTVKAGEVTWEITASRDRLSALHDHLGEHGIPFTVDSIYRELETARLLTDEQWRVLTRAVREGYYDTPRTCTQEELAERLGIAKSTCSGILHRAEERIVKQFIEDNIDDAITLPESTPIVA